MWERNIQSDGATSQRQCSLLGQLACQSIIICSLQPWWFKVERLSLCPVLLGLGAGRQGRQSGVKLTFYSLWLAACCCVSRGVPESSDTFLVLTRYNIYTSRLFLGADTVTRVCVKCEVGYIAALNQSAFMLSRRPALQTPWLRERANQCFLLPVHISLIPHIYRSLGPLHQVSSQACISCMFWPACTSQRNREILFFPKSFHQWIKGCVE